MHVRVFAKGYEFHFVDTLPKALWDFAKPYKAEGFLGGAVGIELITPLKPRKLLIPRSRKRVLLSFDLAGW